MKLLLKEGNVDANDEIHFDTSTADVEISFEESYYRVLSTLSAYEIGIIDKNIYYIYPNLKSTVAKSEIDNTLAKIISGDNRDVINNYETTIGIPTPLRTNTIFWDVLNNMIIVYGYNILEKLIYTLEVNRLTNIIRFDSKDKERTFIENHCSPLYKKLKSLKNRNIFTVEEYRKCLESYYRYPIDEPNFILRKKYIDKISNEQLQKIINDTREFIIYLLDKMQKENRTLNDKIFTYIEISENVEYISNNCHGGWPADILFNPLCFGENFWISRKILLSFFKDFTIYVHDDEGAYPTDDDKDVYTLYTITELHISGNVETFNRLCSDNLFKKEQEAKLVKVLTLIKEKTQVK